MTRRSKFAQALGLAGWLAAAFAAGGVGAFASIEAASSYAQFAAPGAEVEFVRVAR